MAIEVPSPETNRIQRSAQPLIGPSGAGGNASAFGGSSAVALSNLGGTLGALGDRLYEQEQQKKKFDALRQFSEFQAQANQMLEEAKRQSPTNLSNFSELATSNYQQMEKDFIYSLPKEFQQEFSVRTGELGASVEENALTFQYQQNDTYFARSIDDAFQKSRNELAQGGTVEDLDAARKSLDEIIDASGLTPEAKTAIRRKAYTGLEAVVYKQEQVRRLTEEAAGGSGSPAQQQAVELMSIVSGGSPDEIKAKALQGEQAAVLSIGSIDTWAALPSRVRASLIAAAADYGGLSDGVVAAVKSGSLEEIAKALRALPTPGADTMGDNVLNPGTTIDDDPRYASLPYEDRLALTNDAEREVAQAMTAAKQVQTAQQKEMVNALHVALYDGTAGQAEIDQARQDGWLTDINDIEKAQKLLDGVDNNLRLAQAAQFKVDNNLTFDPMDDRDKKGLNALVGKQGIAALQAQDMNYAQNYVVPLVRDTKDIPTDVADLLRGMMRSDDPAKSKYAFDLLNQLQQASPSAYVQRMDETDRNLVDFFDSRRDYYPNQDELMRVVHGGLTVEQRRQTETLRGEAKAQLNDPKVGPNVMAAAHSAFADTALAGDTTPAAWAAAEFNGDFRKLFEDEYVLYGNVQEAQAHALNRMQEVWGVTDVGGQNRLMKYPPEAAGYRPIGGDFSWAENQVLTEFNLSLIPPARSFVEGLSTAAQILNPITAGPAIVRELSAPIYAPPEGSTPIQNFQLISDPQTGEEVKSHNSGWLGGAVAPSYLVVITKQDGTTELLQDENGVPKRMFFQITAAERQAQIEDYERRRAQAMYHEDAKVFQNAIQHSLETGIPIPEDVGVGIRDTLMGGPDAAP